MHLLGDVLLVWLALTVSLAYVGYGVARLTLPASLWRWRLLLSPFVGYAAVVMAFWLLNREWFSGYLTTVVVLACATVLNWLALSRGRTSRTAATRGRSFRVCEGTEADTASCRGEPSACPHTRGRRTASPVQDASPFPLGKGARGLGQPWTELAVVTAIALVVYLLGVLPLLSYGYPSIIGTNRDFEQYLATADYYREFARSAVPLAPDHPMRATAARPVHSAYAGGLLGVSYLLAFLTSLLHCPALRVFAPTMAVFAAANIVGLYVLARVVFALRKRPSAFAALALGLNSMILWTAFFNYAKQMAVIPLLPVAVLAYAVLLRYPSWRSGVFAGLMLAAVALTYWPGTVWFLAAVGILTASTAIGRPRLRKVVAVAIAVLALGLIPLRDSLPVYWNLMVRVLFDNISAGERLSGYWWGFNEFVPIAHLLGLDYFEWPRPLPAVERLGPALGAFVEQAQSVLTPLCFALAALGIGHSLRRRRFVPLTLGLTSVLALLAPWLAEDHYYYFKSVTMSSFAAVGLAVLGIAVAWRTAGRARRTLALAGKGVLSIVGALLLGLAGANAWYTMAHFTDEPHSWFKPPYLDVSQVVERIERGASVFLTSDPRLRHGPMAAVAYSLMGHPLYGVEPTVQYPPWRNVVWLEPGKGGWFAPTKADPKAAGAVREQPGRQPLLCDYGLFAADEDPADSGYFGELVWGNEAIKVFGRGPTLARLEFGSDGARVTAKQPLEFVVSEPVGAVREPPPSGYSLVFQMATLVEQRVSVEVDGKPAPSLALPVDGEGTRPGLPVDGEGTRLGLAVDGEGTRPGLLVDGEGTNPLIPVPRPLTPGLWRITVPIESLPARVKVSANGEQPLFVHWVQLMGGSDDPSATRLSDYVVAGVQSRKEGDRVVTQVRWLGPQPAKVPGWAELRVRKVPPQGGEVWPNQSLGALVARWPLGSSVEEAQVVLHLADGVIEALPRGSASAGARWSPNEGDGQYVAELLVNFANIDRPVRERQTVELFGFTLKDGKVVETRLKDSSLAYRYFPVSSWTAVEATFGETLRLVGYTVDEADSKQEKSVRLSLYWEVPKGATDWRVLARVLDGEGRIWGQRDESLKSAAVHDLGWPDREVLRQRLTVPLDQAASGEYTVELQVYSPVTMQTLPVQGGRAAEGNRLLLGPVSK